MSITITGKHIEITEAIRDHVESKASKLPHYLDSVGQIEVIIEGHESILRSVEVIVRVKHHDHLVAKEQGPEVYACIDLVMHKMEQQLFRIKEKQRGNKHISLAERERLRERAVTTEEEVA